jgi:hypothetical protein
MCKAAFRTFTVLVIMCAAFLPLFSLQKDIAPSANQVDAVDALMLAQYYVGLLPVNQESAVMKTASGMKTLSIEIAGRNTMMFALDSLYISPPGQIIKGNSKFTFEAGAQVKLYFVSATPQPVTSPKLTPVEYQTASFLGHQGTNIDIIMDSDKTIRVGYSTEVIIFPDKDLQQDSPANGSEIADID